LLFKLERGSGGKKKAPLLPAERGEGRAYLAEKVNIKEDKKGNILLLPRKRGGRPPCADLQKGGLEEKGRSEISNLQRQKRRKKKGHN